MDWDDHCDVLMNAMRGSRIFFQGGGRTFSENQTQYIKCSPFYFSTQERNALDDHSITYGTFFLVVSVI